MLMHNQLHYDLNMIYHKMFRNLSQNYVYRITSSICFNVQLRYVLNSLSMPDLISSCVDIKERHQYRPSLYNLICIIYY